jgi:hypothetical protein
VVGLRLTSILGSYRNPALLATIAVAATLRASILQKVLPFLLTFCVSKEIPFSLDSGDKLT